MTDQGLDADALDQGLGGIGQGLDQIRPETGHRGVHQTAEVPKFRPVTLGITR